MDDRRRNFRLRAGSGMAEPLLRPYRSPAHTPRLRPERRFRHSGQRCPRSDAALAPMPAPLRPSRLPAFLLSAPSVNRSSGLALRARLASPNPVPQVVSGEGAGAGRDLLQADASGTRRGAPPLTSTGTRRMTISSHRPWPENRTFGSGRPAATYPPGISTWR